MEVEHILILAICGLGVVHGLSLGVYLIITAQAKSLANNLLGALLVLFGLRISKSVFLYFTSDLDFLLITLGLSLILSFGPLFYFYVRSYLEETFQLRKEHFIHAVPFLVFMGLNSFGLLGKGFYVAFGIYFIYLHFLAYIIATFFWQKRYWKTPLTNGLELKKKWINYLQIGIVLIWVSYFVFLLDGLVPYIVGPITYSLVIYPLSFWAIANKVLQPTEKKYQNSKLNNLASQQIITKLEAYIKTEKPFLNADLKLPMVAAQLNTTPHALSQVVNENFQQNFRQYLNSHRVKSAQRMLGLEENAHLTIASIAYDCGFNSLSAFNTAFKKALDKTPSQYRKEGRP
jgi:AraC-like DNA-binding protein